MSYRHSSFKNNEKILSNFQLTFNPRDIDLPFGQCIILYIPDKCLRLWDEPKKQRTNATERIPKKAIDAYML